MASEEGNMIGPDGAVSPLEIQCNHAMQPAITKASKVRRGPML